MSGAGGLAKLMFAVRAKPGLTRAQALDHLRLRHAPLVAACATNRRRLRTYVQNHAVDAVGVPNLTSERDWIIESWRDLSVVLPEPPVAPDAMALREDEARFPDRATLLTLQVEEVPSWVADADAAFAAAPVKLFTYAKRRRDLDPNDFGATWAERAGALAAHPAFRRLARSFVRNRPVPGAGAPRDATAAPSAAVVPPVDAVDIWRFADLASLEALMADAAFRAAMVDFETSLFERPVIFRLATTENLVFDDAGINPAAREGVRS